MIVGFVTDTGARYSLDHSKKKFFQSHPIERSGDLWNAPQVKKGSRVEIWTEPVGGKGVARVIHTGLVVRRQVRFD